MISEKLFPYESPTIEVIELVIESPILTGSGIGQLNDIETESAF